MYRRAKCCRPIPGEDVTGYVTRGRGIIIHGRSCPNAMRLSETESERLIPLEWPPDGTTQRTRRRVERAILDELGAEQVVSSGPKIERDGDDG